MVEPVVANGKQYLLLQNNPLLLFPNFIFTTLRSSSRNLRSLFSQPEGKTLNCRLAGVVWLYTWVMCVVRCSPHCLINIRRRCAERGALCSAYWVCPVCVSEKLCDVVLASTLLTPCFRSSSFSGARLHFFPSMQLYHLQDRTQQSSVRALAHTSNGAVGAHPTRWTTLPPLHRPQPPQRAAVGDAELPGWGAKAVLFN